MRRDWVFQNITVPAAVSYDSVRSGAADACVNAIAARACGSASISDASSW